MARQSATPRTTVRRDTEVIEKPPFNGRIHLDTAASKETLKLRAHLATFIDDLHRRKATPVHMASTTPNGRILRVLGRDSDLVLFPIDLAILDAQHLTLTAACLESAD